MAAALAAFAGGGHAAPPPQAIPFMVRIINVESDEGYLRAKLIFRVAGAFMRSTLIVDNGWHYDPYDHAEYRPETDQLRRLELWEPGMGNLTLPSITPGNWALTFRIQGFRAISLDTEGDGRDMMFSTISNAVRDLVRAKIIAAFREAAPDADSDIDAEAGQVPSDDEQDEGSSMASDSGPSHSIRSENPLDPEGDLSL